MAILKLKNIRPGNLMAYVVLLAAGLVIGHMTKDSWAQRTPPTEHKGLSVETLGVIPEESIKAQVGLEGHILLLRAITIEPGGQIAKHSHEKVPGLVKVISGEWIEGGESGEKAFNADTPTAIVEDKDTVNWFYNRGTEPATAIVCDIKPAS
ncbi:MAG: cupin domain-containing protein [Myxococcota bacterium]